jgi:5-methylcytosine-specific restriction endonuclease McrBC regulatory subunit McrC
VFDYFISLSLYTTSSVLTNTRYVYYLPYRLISMLAEIKIHVCMSDRFSSMSLSVRYYENTSMLCIVILIVGIVQVRYVHSKIDEEN